MDKCFIDKCCTVKWYWATTKFCPWTNVVWKNVARKDVTWTNVAQTDVAWTNVAWTNVAWSNGTGSLVNSQGWFHKLEMSSTVLKKNIPGWVGANSAPLELGLGLSLAKTLHLGVYLTLPQGHTCSVYYRTI